MEKKRPDRHDAQWGSWLSSQIKSRGLNKTEFARRVGVSHSTVSRWVAGRLPEADLVDSIADALMLDYDLVNTMAKYRPRGLMTLDPESTEAKLLPIIRRIPNDEQTIERLRHILEAFVDMQRDDYGKEEVER